MLSIPLDAVYKQKGRKYAYQRDGSRPKKVAVTLGAAQDDRVVVTGGLTAGQTVYIILPPERGLYAGLRAVGQKFKNWLKPAAQPPADEQPAPRRPRGAPPEGPGRPSRRMPRRRGTSR